MAATSVPAISTAKILMTRAGLGMPRVESAKRRLLELNPDLEIETLNAHINTENVSDLVAKADVVVDAVPRFEERFLLNAACVKQKKALIDCAMYDLEARLTTIVPGRTPCLACLYPELPPAWKREFPVFGAVAGMVGSLGALEALKVIGGFGEPLLGRMAVFDLRTMSFATIPIARLENCSVCGGLKN